MNSESNSFMNTFYTEPHCFKRWCIHDSKLLSS